MRQHPVVARARALAFASLVGRCRRAMKAEGFPRGLIGRRYPGGPLKGLGFVLAGVPPLEVLSSWGFTVNFSKRGKGLITLHCTPTKSRIYPYKINE